MEVTSRSYSTPTFAAQRPATPMPAQPRFEGFLRRRRQQNEEPEALFPNGVSGLHIAQGMLPDCQLLAPIYALSRNPAGAKLIEEMITPLPNGLYQVRFPAVTEKISEPRIKRNGEQGRIWVERKKEFPETTVVVTPHDLRTRPHERPHHTTRRQASGDLGVRVLECAYARLMLTRYPRMYRDISDDDILSLYNKRNYHKQMEKVLRDFTGWETPNVRIFWPFHPNGPKAKMKRLEKFLNEYARNPKQYVVLVGTYSTWENAPHPVTELRRVARQELRQKDPLWLEQLDQLIEKVFVPDELEKRPIDRDVSRKVPGHHALTVEAVDTKNRTVTLRDPHTTKVGMVLTYEDFLKQAAELKVAKVPGNNT